MKNHKTTTLLMIAMVLSACDAEQDDETWHEMDLESNEDIDPELVMDLVDQERWEDGLEELLDPVCDEHGCRWAWTDLEKVGLGEIVELLPEVPEGLEAPEILEGPEGPRPHTGMPTDIQLTQEAGSKLLTINSIRCLDRQEISGDEPYITIDGVRIWTGHDFTSGTSKQLYLARSYGASAEIEVWEDDPSYDDFIGGHEVWSWTANGQDSRIYYGSSAAYQIYYTISGG